MTPRTPEFGHGQGDLRLPLQRVPLLRAGKRYSYHTCAQAIKSGRKTCPAKSLPATEIERVVVDRVRCIAPDSKLRAEVVRQAPALAEGDLEQLQSERKGLERDLKRYHTELRKLATDQAVAGRKASRIADLQDLVGHARETSRRS